MFFRYLGVHKQTPLGLYMASEKATYEELREIWVDLTEDWSRDMLLEMIIHKQWCYQNLVRMYDKERSDR